MKKLIACSLSLLLVLSAAGGTALAHHGGRGYHRQSRICTAEAACGQNCLFLDEDLDGICDTCGGAQSCPLCDADGDGLCDSCGQPHHHCAENHSHPVRHGCGHGRCR